MSTARAAACRAGHGALPRRLSLPAGLALLLALGACGHGSSTTPAAMIPGKQQPAGKPPVAASPGVSPNLPSMAQLAASKATSATDADRFRAGSAYDTALSSAHVTTNGTHLAFSPQWNTLAANDKSKVGLAIFELPLAGLAGAQDLTLNWFDPPKDYANLFIGLSNFSQGRWDWVQGTAAPLALADIAPYQAADGRVFVAVMLLGLQNAELSWLKVGGNLAPTAGLTVQAASGVAPFNASFDAGSSSDLDGTVVRYDWDFDNDGSIEAPDGGAQQSHIYAVTGDYTCAVTVTDNSGGTAKATTDVHAVAAGGPPTAAVAVDYTFNDVPFTAQLDASASVVPNGVLKYEWDLDNNGSYEVDTGTVATTPWPVSSAGQSTAGVRVTDTLLQTSTATIAVTGDAAGYDEVENNDTFGTGNTLPAASFAGFDGNLGDSGTYDADVDDWYKLVVPAPMALQFDMLFLQADGDLDMKLFDTTTDGTTGQLASSTSTADNEHITYSFTTPGTYYLHCYLYTNSVGRAADYSLGVRKLVPPQVSLSALPPAGPAPLLVDFTATATDDGTIASYEWDFNGDGTYEFNSGTTPTASHTYNSGGTHNATVRVKDNDGAAATAQAPVTVSVTYDEIEQNDSSATAQSLPAVDFDRFVGNIGIGGPLDGDESDWYKFSTGAGQELCFILHQDSSEADLDLTLYDTDGTTVILTSAGSDDDEYVSFTSPLSGTYFLNVFVHAGATLRGPTDYVLSGYAFTLNETEPNETFDTGNTLPAAPFVKFGGALEANAGTHEPHDWYKLTIAAPGTVTLWMRFIDDLCDEDMKLFDTDGMTEIGSSTSTDNEEKITYTFTSAGTYYVQCYNYALGPCDYILQAE